MGEREVWRGCAREHAHEPVRVEIGLRRASVTKNVIEGAERRDLLVGMAKVCGACQNTSNFLVWRECFHVAAATSGGERSWISTALNLSTTTMAHRNWGRAKLSHSLAATQFRHAQAHARKFDVCVFARAASPHLPL